ncbi:MAG: hypothetical protein V9E96_00200 [Chitinophagaceae bacterium]
MELKKMLIKKEALLFRTNADLSKELVSFNVACITCRKRKRYFVKER